jgi:putative ATP-dependent endonuclease of OLD family
LYYLSKRENFDTFNLIFAKKLILVEGATEEIYLNCLLQHDNINNITVISVGQKGFKIFIEIWSRLHSNTDRLGVIRDYDFQDKAKLEHHAFNSEFVYVSTATGKEFEYDFVNQSNNLTLLNEIFSKTYVADEMIELMTNDKLNNIIFVCQSIEAGKDFEIPDYIKTLLEWIK